MYMYILVILNRFPTDKISRAQNANKHSHSTIIEMQRISVSFLSNAVSRYDITGQSSMNEKKLTLEKKIG